MTKNSVFGHPERSQRTSISFGRPKRSRMSLLQTQSTLISADFQLYFYLSDIYEISVKDRIKLCVLRELHG